MHFNYQFEMDISKIVLFQINLIFIDSVWHIDALGNIRITTTLVWIGDIYTKYLQHFYQNARVNRQFMVATSFVISPTAHTDIVCLYNNPKRKIVFGSLGLKKVKSYFLVQRKQRTSKWDWKREKMVDIWKKKLTYIIVFSLQ